MIVDGGSKGQQSGSVCCATLRAFFHWPPGPVANAHSATLLPSFHGGHKGNLINYPKRAGSGGGLAQAALRRPAVSVKTLVDRQ